MIVVLGAEVAQSQALLAGRPVQVVLNPAWAEGQSTSMKAGLAALPPTVDSAVFLLVDLPGVTPDIISTLIQRHRQSLAPLVWPEYEGQRGNPILFDRTLFPELAQVSGDTGGRPVVMKYKDQAERVTWPSGGFWKILTGRRIWSNTPPFEREKRGNCQFVAHRRLRHACYSFARYSVSIEYHITMS